tara:strand:+ start:71 stop:346 length:276 start_codon:yes stop_codon:yes gene_type:complete
VHVQAQVARRCLARLGPHHGVQLLRTSPLDTVARLRCQRLIRVGVRVRVRLRLRVRARHRVRVRVRVRVRFRVVVVGQASLLKQRLRSTVT